MREIYNAVLLALNAYGRERYNDFFFMIAWEYANLLSDILLKRNNNSSKEAEVIRLYQTLKEDGLGAYRGLSKGP